MTLKEMIAEHMALMQGMGDMAGADGWNSSARRVSLLERQILEHPCTTKAQFKAWYNHMHFIPALAKRITPQMIAEQAQRVREADKARSPTGRTFDNPQTTYEVGIIGSDRVPVVTPTPGSKSKYHRKYPLEIMEVGEEILVPGVKIRAEVAGTLAAAQRRHKRRFSTTSTDAGLLVKRIE